MTRPPSTPTSADVAKWIQTGQFGLRHETSRLNELIRPAASCGESLGESVGAVIEEEKLPYRHLSIVAADYCCGSPVTSHVTVGADIIHFHPKFGRAALRKTICTDFLILARAIKELEGGVFLNVGSAVTGPEVFLKALSLARIIGHQHAKQNRNFTTAVSNLFNLPANRRDGPPSSDDPLYYFGPWKTLLSRMEFQLRLSADNFVAAAYSLGQGCVVSHAAASILCERVEGMSMIDLRALTRGSVLGMVGVQLSPIRQRCVVLAFEALSKISIPAAHTNVPMARV